MKKFYFALMALLGVNTCAFADNWMSHLPDETYVAAVSIPGTHDSGTGNGFDGFLGETFARTQDISFGDQWKIGIRAFDLRPCTTKDGYLNINHELWLQNCVSMMLFTSCATRLSQILRNLL